MSRPGSFISRLACIGALPFLLACAGQNDRPEAMGPDRPDMTQSIEGQPYISFDTLEYDFGTIIEGEKVVCYFDYENTGNADLVIRSVETTCGCTTPGWSTEPLEPGARKSMQIIFDATGRKGQQRKVVTVKTNASNSEVKITLKANIET
jgi:hypothetical protein